MPSVQGIEPGMQAKGKVQPVRCRERGIGAYSAFVSPTWPVSRRRD
jgi:hypothetical protein